MLHPSRPAKRSSRQDCRDKLTGESLPSQNESLLAPLSTPGARKEEIMGKLQDEEVSQSLVSQSSFQNNGLKVSQHSCCQLGPKSDPNTSQQYLCSSNSKVLEKLVTNYNCLPLKDQEFMLSNDTTALLAVNGSRRRCQKCQSCLECNFSRNYVSYQDHEETVRMQLCTL